MAFHQHSSKCSVCIPAIPLVNVLSRDVTRANHGLSLTVRMLVLMCVSVMLGRALD
jgi:hypothetical protein